MSQSSLQVLLHAGELEYIVRATKNPQQQNSKFVAGCLFGLWRNSLKQPVIQFVTGPPAKGFKTIENMLDHNYVKHCAQIMEEDHCLLHLGFWFCGPNDDQSQRTVQDVVFQTHDSTFKVLLFINISRERNTEKLIGKYMLKTETDAIELFKEDVLNGHSSFRLYEPLRRKLELKPSGREIGQDILSLVKNLPSRVQVEEAVTNEDQWYSTDEGTVHLQLLFQYFSSAGIQPGMSRDAITHNIQFELSGGYCLDFPANFPRRMPILRAADGTTSELPRSPDRDVCQFVVNTVVEYFRKQQSGGSRGRGGGGRYR